MLDGDLFDKLAKTASIVRRRIQPFGGIQVDPSLLFSWCPFLFI